MGYVMAAGKVIHNKHEKFNEMLLYRDKKHNKMGRGR